MWAVRIAPRSPPHNGCRLRSHRPMPAASDITPDEGNTATVALDAALEAVLHIVRTRTGVDFGCYRVPMLHRRVSNRLVSLGTPSLTDYVSLLRSSATE